jgi:2-succinyl-5-enolpyruvyl-6-hydroxy-3-cyclohexene-1-carboxylate synthase
LPARGSDRGPGASRSSVSGAIDATNRNTALASALVEELARCGVRRAVVAPGSRSTPLALAVWRQPAIEATVVVDERSAGYFAVGAAQASGAPVAVLCTSGTAAANLHPAVVEADESAVALLVLTSDRPPELRGIGAGQTIDQLKLYGDSVRWFCEVGSHDADDDGLLHYRSVACHAYAAARGEPRPGPVHLNLAWRDPLGPEPREGDVTASSPLALEGRGDRPLTAVSTAPHVPEDALLDELAERIGSAPRGLIVAGRQADSSLAAPVTALARAAGYPILAEPTSQLRLGEHDRGHVVWAYDAIARRRPEQLAPEVVVRFGDMPTSKALRGWLAEIPGLRQIVVDPRFGWNEPTRRAETLVRGDPSATASGLARRLTPPAPDLWSDPWLRSAGAAGEAIEAALERLEEPTEPGLHAELGRVYADGDLVYTASSMPIRDQEFFLAPGPARVRFLCNRGANGIDGLVSSGIAAASVTGRPTWIVTGDLGVYHDMNGLAALRETSTPVRIVVPNNAGGAIFEFLPQAEQIGRDEFEALFATPVELSIERVADLYGLAYRRLDDLDRLAEAAREPRAIIEVPVDRSRNVALHRRLAEAGAAALGAARGH